MSMSPAATRVGVELRAGLPVRDETAEHDAGALAVVSAGWAVRRERQQRYNAGEAVEAQTKRRSSLEVHTRLH